jgi:hypothetical protein
MSEIPMAPGPHVEQKAQPARRSTVRRVGPAAGLVLAGLVAGALGVGVLGHTPTTTASTVAVPVRPGGPPGGVAGGPGGGMAGEIRVGGTITAVSSSGLTVEQADGTTATYAANGTTDVRRDGAQSSLSALKVGDRVLVHVLPSTSGSGTVAERILAGTSATGGGPGGPPPAGSGTGTSATTGTGA